MNFAIIGCGLIGQKRLAALGREHRLVIAADSDEARARSMVARHGQGEAASDWHTAVSHGDVQAVIVATTNNWLAPIAQAAIGAGRHVLVEKPAARNAQELEPLVRAAESRGVCTHVGFNHRYHPALLKARELCDGGALGDLMFIRGRYGHGGRVGYDREWRANPEVSGGGELLDQGVHLIDLSRWFLGEFTGIEGHAATYFWKMPVDDNAFLSLRTARGQTAWLQVSCTEWKNMFCLEIYGRDGKLQIDGLGGSYGVERLSYYKMLPQMGPPETTIWEYPGEDRSWQRETESFVRCIQERRPAEAGLRDAAEALKIVQRIYALSRLPAGGAKPGGSQP